MNKPNRIETHALLVPAAAVLAALLLAWLLAGCGGGEDLLPLPVAAAPRAAAIVPPLPQTLRLEGCVVDEYFIPRSDAPVRALGADGRLLANAQSDSRGEFKLQVPPGQTISLAIDRPGGDVIKVATGQRSRALTTCLLDPSA